MEVQGTKSSSSSSSSSSILFVACGFIFSFSFFEVEGREEVKMISIKRSGVKQRKGREMEEGVGVSFLPSSRHFLSFLFRRSNIQFHIKRRRTYERITGPPPLRRPSTYLHLHLHLHLLFPLHLLSTQPPFPCFTSFFSSSYLVFIL